MTTNPFADLIPAAPGSTIPSTNTTGSGPLQGPRPTPAGFRDADGVGIDTAAFRAARATYQGRPAPTGGGGAPATGTPGTPAPGTPPGAAPGAAPSGTTAAVTNFANSAGMQFQLQEAANAINHRYAGAGQLQSGAAMKAISDRSQDIALNNFFMPYVGLLGNQQAVGAGAASSIAGVGSSFANNAAGINAGLANGITGINGAMGGAIANGANNAGNLALANGQNSANMWNQVGGALGGFASSF